MANFQRTHALPRNISRRLLLCTPHITRLQMQIWSRETKRKTRKDAAANGCRSRPHYTRAAAAGSSETMRAVDAATRVRVRLHLMWRMCECANVCECAACGHRRLWRRCDDERSVHSEPILLTQIPHRSTKERVPANGATTSLVVSAPPPSPSLFCISNVHQSVAAPS